MRGGLATLTVNSWDGEPPTMGHYLRALRGRTAFLIVEVLPAKPGSRYVCKVRCERHRTDRVPPNAIVHRWEWAKR